MTRAPISARVLGPLRRFGESGAMLAIQQSLPWSFSGLIVGGLLVFLTAHGSLQARVFPALSGGFGTMSLVLVVVLAYVLARRYALPLAVVVPGALAAFFLSLPRGLSLEPIETAIGIGATGILLAILIDLGVAGCALLGKLRLGDRYGALTGALAFIAITAVLWNLNLSLAIALNAMLRPLGTLGDSLLGFVIVTAIEAALWTAGIHGPALLAGVVTPVYLALQAQNSAAQARGNPMPHIVTVSTFLFVFPGGAGATLSLVLLLLRSRVARLRKIGAAVLIPALFNTNEPLMFSVPLVFNPMFTIPYVLVPTITAVTTYAAMAGNLVARPVAYVPSAIPTLISVFLATLDWHAIVLALVNLAIGAAIYAPFLRAYERVELAKSGADAPST